MTPETPVIVAPVTPDDAAAVLDETAVTLDALGESVEELSEQSRDRADEILREVRECRSMVSQLSQLLPQQQTESPSMQQALIQLTALQTTVEKIQSEVEALRASNRSPPVEEVNPSGNPDGRKESQGSPGPPNTPTSNQSATPPPAPEPEPKKKRYVKI